MEVLLGLANRRLLLGTHLEVACAPLDIGCAIAHGEVSGPHVVDGTAEPLRLLAVAVPLAPEAVRLEVRVHVVVHKDGAVGAHRRLDEHNLIGLLAGLERRVVLAHTLINVTRGIADL